jgi:hypothetical protein
MFPATNYLNASGGSWLLQCKVIYKPIIWRQSAGWRTVHMLADGRDPNRLILEHAVGQNHPLTYLVG